MKKRPVLFILILSLLFAMGTGFSESIEPADSSVPRMTLPDIYPSRTRLPEGAKLDKDTTIKYYEIEDKIGFVGRWYIQTVNGKDCYVTNNGGSECYIQTQNTMTVEILWEPMTSGEAFYAYSIDGGQVIRTSIVNQTIVLPDDSTHIIRIITDGIAENIGKWPNGTGYAFSDITSSGTITGVIPCNPQIMFFGDSITDGTMVLGHDKQDLGTKNSATSAFPWYCCEQLGAIPFRVGYGGSGITVKGSFETAQNALRYLYKGAPTGTYFPDAIVINLGTNDAWTSSKAFINGYNAFLKKIKETYPGVKTFLMIPFSGAHAKDIKTIGKQNKWCYVIDASRWKKKMEYTEDGIHPTAKGAQYAGERLAKEMKTVLNTKKKK